MSTTITHAFTSAKSDGSDTSLVRPSNWNAAHTVDPVIVRTATIVVAASDSSTDAIAQADYACDGTADDVEIQEAIDALPSNGGTVKLLSGNYTITDTITFGSLVTIEGEGVWATSLTANLTKAIFQSKGTSTRYYRSFIRDLLINNTDKTNSGGIGIDFTKITLGGIERVEIKNVETAILFDQEAYYNTIYDAMISTVVTAMVFTNAANENWIFGGRTNVCTTGLNISSATNIQVYGHSIENFTTGISVGASAGGTKIIGSRMDAGTTGISIASGATKTTIIAPHYSGVTTRVSDSGTDTIIIHAQDLKHPLRKSGVATNVTLDASGIGAIAHGCSTTPTVAFVQCQSANLNVRISSIDATNINIVVYDLDNAAVTADTHDFYWKAEV